MVDCCDVCDYLGSYKVQQNKHPNLQHLKKRKGFLELHRVFQGCFPFSSTTIAGKKHKFITTRKKHNTQEEILVGRLNEALNTTNMENSALLHFRTPPSFY